jgi:hypothetical protein
VFELLDEWRLNAWCTAARGAEEHRAMYGARPRSSPAGSSRR